MTGMGPEATWYLGEQDTPIAALERAAKSHPDRVLLDFSGQLVTYGEVDMMSTRLAHELAALGMQAGQTVVTMLRVSYEFGVSRAENEPVTRQGHILVADAIACGDGKAASKNMSAMLEKNRGLAKVEYAERPSAPSVEVDDQVTGSQ